MGDIWAVSFISANSIPDIEKDYIRLEGMLYVKADNIFEALDKAKIKLRTLGFESYEISHVRNIPREDDIHAASLGEGL